MPVTEAMLRGVFQQMSAVPTGATRLAPGQPARVNIPIPETALEVTEMLTRTLSLEWLGKDVRFFNPDLLPQPLRASLQAPGQVIRQAITLPFVRQFLQLVAPGTKGDVGQLAATLQTPVGSAVPVSFEWRWSVTDEGGKKLVDVTSGIALQPDQKGFLAPQGLDVPQTSFLIQPPVRKLEDWNLAPVTCKVTGGVRLQAGGIDTGWLDFPEPIPFLIEPLQMPTILALFLNRNFQAVAEDRQGAVLVVVPERSPLVALEPYLQAINAAGTAVQALGPLLSLLPFGTAADGVRTAIAAHGQYAHLARQDDIANLHDWTLIQRWLLEDDTEADRVWSLILVGVPGTTVRLYNDPGFGTSRGVLEVTTGDEGYVLLRNLDAADPQTEPAGCANAVVPSAWNSFRETIASVRFTA
jgi:hypothetical protein